MSDKILEPKTAGTILIGEGVEFKGDVSVPGCASIDGKFEGVLKAKALIVGPSGHVSGQISVETAEIRGAVGDQLTVQSNLILRSTGSISGAVRYSKIMVEEGGTLAGTIEKITMDKAEAADAKVDPNVYQLQRNAEVG
jgi:cytoskeletal protein CcmA (bactofilin family)